MEEKGWKGSWEGMKLKLGFWIGDEKRVSEVTTFPPPMVDITWQSPYIFASFQKYNFLKEIYGLVENRYVKVCQI